MNVYANVLPTAVYFFLFYFILFIYFIYLFTVRKAREKLWETFLNAKLLQYNKDLECLLQRASKW